VLLVMMCKYLLQIQPEWKPLVASATDGLLSAFARSGVAEQDVLGVYLRGSVPQGTAVQYISDLDISAYILIDPQVNGNVRDAAYSTSDAGFRLGRAGNGRSTVSSERHSTVADIAASRNNNVMQSHSVTAGRPGHDNQHAGTAAVDYNTLLGYVAEARAAVEAQFPVCTKAGMVLSIIINSKNSFRGCLLRLLC
jgi:hypothetical protein